MHIVSRKIGRSLIDSLAHHDTMSKCPQENEQTPWLLVLKKRSGGVRRVARAPRSSAKSTYGREIVDGDMSFTAISLKMALPFGIGALAAIRSGTGFFVGIAQRLHSPKTWNSFGRRRPLRESVSSTRIPG